MRDEESKSMEKAMTMRDEESKNVEKAMSAGEQGEERLSPATIAKGKAADATEDSSLLAFIGAWLFFSMILFIAFEAVAEIRNPFFTCNWSLIHGLWIGKLCMTMAEGHATKTIGGRHRDIGGNAAKMASRLARRTELPDVGWAAELGLRQAEALPAAERGARHALDASFEPGSLSWDRYAGTIDMMGDTILRHLDALDDGLAPFATEEHIAERVAISQSYLGKPDDTPQLKAFTKAARGILDDNDTLLSEMARMEAELTRLRYDNLAEGSEAAIDEAKDAIDDVRLYGNRDMG